MTKLDFMLAKEWSENMKKPRGIEEYEPPIGWKASEKMDGYRGRYCKKTKKSLGWRPKVGLVQSLKKIDLFYKKNFKILKKLDSVYKDQSFFK